MTKHEAEYLAGTDSEYRARKLHGEWCVWCDASDHEVEFDNATLRRVAETVNAMWAKAMWNI